MPPRPRSSSTAALRLARRAWRLLYSDSQCCSDAAAAALTRAAARGDVAAEGWARLALGFHLIWYATPAEALQELQAARRCFSMVGDRAGDVLAEVGVARCDWRSGHYHAALQRVLPLRDVGLSLLKHDERGMLLGTIAGCYSELGQSQQAFAYMYQALQASSRARSQGFDVVLYCNLAHELIQLGDYHQALSYLREGLQRCARLNNPRLYSVLGINLVICLTNLERPAEALADVRRLMQLPADKDGRGPMNAHFETLALAALRAGDTALGTELVERARGALGVGAVPDERITLQVAAAELLMAQGRHDAAEDLLRRSLSDARDGRIEGLSLRVRCLYFHALAAAHERAGRPAEALAMLREWQRAHVERALQASEARYQAAALQTELLRMRADLDAAEARRQRIERDRAELESANQQLERKVAEVQALQQALKEQATRDFLTGLFNRRHLGDVLPGLLAMAQRDGQPLAVVIIDLDHFKAVNDRFGHAAGDRLLADFGRLLDGQCRRSDVACRYGGEEFCLLLPRTAAAAARRKCQALLRQWSLLDRPGPESAAGRTFSAGVADSLGVDGGPEALLRAADEALLRAKRSGRNRVLLHEAGSRAVA